MAYNADGIIAVNRMPVGGCCEGKVLQKFSDTYTLPKNLHYETCLTYCVQHSYSACFVSMPGKQCSCDGKVQVGRFSHPHTVIT